MKPPLENDGFMPIDEIGQGNDDVRHVAGSAYSLFNGTGRIQGNKDGETKPFYVGRLWRYQRVRKILKLTSFVMVLPQKQGN